MARGHSELVGIWLGRDRCRVCSFCFSLLCVGFYVTWIFFVDVVKYNMYYVQLHILYIYYDMVMFDFFFFNLKDHTTSLPLHIFLWQIYPIQKYVSKRRRSRPSGVWAVLCPGKLLLYMYGIDDKYYINISHIRLQKCSCIRFVILVSRKPHLTFDISRRADRQFGETIAQQFVLNRQSCIGLAQALRVRIDFFALLQALVQTGGIMKCIRIHYDAVCIHFMQTHV